MPYILSLISIKWILKYFRTFWYSQILSITQPAAPYSSMVQPFEYGPASLSQVQPFCVWRSLPEHGTAFLSMVQTKLFQHRHSVVQNLDAPYSLHVNHSVCAILKLAGPYSGRLHHIQKGCAWLKLAGLYSKGCTILEYGTAGWVIIKIWEFQNVAKYFRIRYKRILTQWEWSWLFYYNSTIKFQSYGPIKNNKISLWSLLWGPKKWSSLHPSQNKQKS